MNTDFDLCGALRRIRRVADLSQRELARSLGISAAAVARAESGTRDLPARVLSRAAAVAGMRLALVDGEGLEVGGMADDAVRDLGGRRFPAHLDTRYADEGWWHDAHRYSRTQVWYTFDLDRGARDGRRGTDGTPGDHQLPRAGDSPSERRAARRREAERRRREEAARRQREAVERRRAAGGLPEPPDFVCTCPPLCAELDIGERPRHAPDCPCGCDVG